MLWTLHVIQQKWFLSRGCRVTLSQTSKSRGTEVLLLWPPGTQHSYRQYVSQLIICVWSYFDICVRGTVTEAEAPILVPSKCYLCVKTRLLSFIHSIVSIFTYIYSFLDFYRALQLELNQGPSDIQCAPLATDPLGSLWVLLFYTRVWNVCTEVYNYTLCALWGAVLCVSTFLCTA